MSTALAVIDNMNDMIMLYLATKKTEGLSDNSINQYSLHLRNFADNMRKKCSRHNHNGYKSILGKVWTNCRKKQYYCNKNNNY